MAGAQPLLDRVARVALAPAVPQPGESLPGSTPALSARPLTANHTPTDKPRAQLRSTLLASHCEGASEVIIEVDGLSTTRTYAATAQSPHRRTNQRGWALTKYGTSACETAHALRSGTTGQPTRVIGILAGDLNCRRLRSMVLATLGPYLGEAGAHRRLIVQSDRSIPMH